MADEKKNGKFFLKYLLWEKVFLSIKINQEVDNVFVKTWKEKR